MFLHKSERNIFKVQAKLKVRLPLSNFGRLDHVHMTTAIGNGRLSAAIKEARATTIAKGMSTWFLSP